jgi:F0F1-type ATP synthase, epsilon subunit (mitochondrial delta subunit)
MLLDVKILNPKEVIFEGQAKAVIVPGEQGIFEILPFHKPILSRLFSGNIYVDDTAYPVRRGVIKVSSNKVTIILEEK